MAANSRKAIPKSVGVVLVRPTTWVASVTVTDDSAMPSMIASCQAIVLRAVPAPIRLGGSSAYAIAVTALNWTARTRPAMDTDIHFHGGMRSRSR
ncbi:MAG: hypothetical protein I8H77_01470 [Comamonadaceae bacterium]|nr:hypothetical protein [Comamonadaceae bacterium]